MSTHCIWGTANMGNILQLLWCMMWINTKCQQWWQFLQRMRFGKYSTRHMCSSEDQTMSETPRTESHIYETSSRKVNKGVVNKVLYKSNGIYAVWWTAALVLLILWNLTLGISSVAGFSIPCSQVLLIRKLSIQRCFARWQTAATVQTAQGAGRAKFRCGLNLRRSSQQRRLISCVAVFHLTRVLIEYVQQNRDMFDVESHST